MTASQTDPGTLDTFLYSFDWDNDGTYDIIDQSSPSAQYTWYADGTYTVSVQVKDDDGGVDTTTTDVDVADLGPTAEFTWIPEQPAEGAAVQFTDASTVAQDTITSWEWLFGNGNGHSGQVPPAQTYADNGVYTVRLTVTDADGSTDFVEHDVTVDNVPPDVDAGQDLTVSKGKLLQFTGTFTDPGILDTHTVEIDWGDGTPKNDQNDPNVSFEETDGSGTVTATHTYQQNGEYTVILTVTDKDGGTGSDTTKVTVIGVELISASYEVCETLLTLVFNNSVVPALTDFNKIDMEIDDSGNPDIGLSNEQCLEAVAGEPYLSDTEWHYPVTIDLLCAVPAMQSLAIAAFITHKSDDIDLLLVPGAFTDPDGGVNLAADVPLEITGNGLELRTKGDCNGDGVITVYDAGLLLQFSVFGKQALPVYDAIVDVSSCMESFGQPNVEVDIIQFITETDGQVGTTANDAAAVLRYIAGFTDVLPASESSAPVADMTHRNGRLVANSYDDQKLEVSIDLSDVRDIHSADIVLTYNPQALTVTDVSETSAVAGWLSAHGTPTPGQLKVSMAGLSQPTEDGSIITVTFDTASADAIKQLDLTELRLNGMKVTVQNMPKAFALLQNYPNPFNPETWIPYHLSEPVDVTVTIYGITGRMVRRLELGNRMPGSYVDKSRAAYWDGKNEWGEEVSSGIYFYQLQAGRDASVKKMIIVR